MRTRITSLLLLSQCKNQMTEHFLLDLGFYWWTVIRPLEYLLKDVLKCLLYQDS